MAALPIGKNHNPRTHAADHPSNFQTIYPGVLDPAIGNVERLAPHDAQKPGSLGGFAFAIGGCAARSHLTAREIENASSPALLRHLQQRAAASLLDIIAVSGDCEDVESRLFRFGSRHLYARLPDSTTTFSRTINRGPDSSLSF